MKPPIQYRPSQRSSSPKVIPTKAKGQGGTEPPDSRERPAPISVSPDTSASAQAALEAYKAAERAKVLARVKKHRAKKGRKNG